MTNLQAYVNGGIEIYVDNVTGESFASISGYARMSGMSKQTISARLQGVKFQKLKTVETLTAGGLQGVKLLSEDLIVQWLPKDNPTMAAKLMKLGVRVFMHQLAGYQITTTAVNPQLTLPQTYLEALEALVASEKEKQALQLKAAEDAPKVELAEAFIERDGLVMLGDFAKDSGKIGRNRLFKLLREKGVLLSNNHPKQAYVDRGLFVLRPCDTLLFGREQFTTHLTPEGVQWLCKRLEDWLSGE